MVAPEFGNDGPAAGNGSSFGLGGTGRGRPPGKIRTQPASGAKGPHAPPHFYRAVRRFHDLGPDRGGPRLGIPQGMGRRPGDRGHRHSQRPYGLCPGTPGGAFSSSPPQAGRPLFPGDPGRPAGLHPVGRARPRRPRRAGSRRQHSGRRPHRPAHAEFRRLGSQPDRGIDAGRQDPASPGRARYPPGRPGQHDLHGHVRRFGKRPGPDRRNRDEHRTGPHRRNDPVDHPGNHAPAEAA